MTELITALTAPDRQQAMAEELRAYVELESPTTDKAAVDRLGAVLAKRLASLGATVETAPQEHVGDHLIGRWGRASREHPGVLILCHMDTVWELGTLTRQPCLIEHGQLYGPGAYDMKASLVIVFHTLEVLRAEHRWPAIPLTVLLTSDEERGSRTSRTLVEDEALNSRIVLCMEPALSGGALKTFRKGTGYYRLIASGRAAHAGAEHESGVNAIEELALQIIKIQHMTDYPAGTTLNVGTIIGGTRTNVVPAHAECGIDLRVTTREAGERIHHALIDLQPHLPGARIEVHGGLNRPPMERSPLMRATFERARAVGATLGLDLHEGESGGGSDANFTAALDIPTLDGLGAQGGGAHAVNEHVRLSSLPMRALLLSALILGM